MARFSTKKKIAWVGVIVAVGLGLNAAASGPSSNTTQQPVVDSASVSTLPVVETKTETNKLVVAFSVIESTDPLLPKGQRKVVTAGVEGERVESYEVTYTDGVQTGKRLVKSEIAKVPVDEVVSVGTYAEPVRSAAPSYSSPAPTYQDNSSSSVYYKNCTAARNAGVAPIYAGEPGYRAALDRDNDGVACE